MVDTFLKRPVLSTVFTIIIFLLGLLGLISLPITLFPEIAPPMIQVSTNYVGANSSTVLKSVIAPLEEQINGVERMTYITSTAGNDGSATIRIYFSLGTNPDMACVNVQGRVSAATSKLPPEVTQYGITTQKSFNSMLMMLSIYSTDPTYDEVFLENYAKISVYPALQRVPGVGRVAVYGMHDYSVRIWLKPDRLSVFDLNPSDVVAAIQEQNIEAAPGQIGRDNNESFSYVLRYKGKYTDPENYENIVIKALKGDQILRVKDVADVEFGSFDYSVSNKLNGYPAMAMSVYQMAGSNAREIVNEICATIEKESKNFPTGVKYAIPYNTNNFLNASIKQVIHTFIEAFLLVFLVVFVFLQDLRSTLIPGIASLVAIVGTFFFMSLMGFSLNMLTLFALVLAIGMVVDDAIVVVEAVHSKLNEGEKDVTKATQDAMHEISAAIVSITLVMSAVFIPVTFITGPVGAFYKQFAITLAIAIVISAVNALSLSPVLCTLLIKPHEDGGNKSFFRRMGDNFNTGFDALTSKYQKAVAFFSDRKLLSVCLIVLFAAGTFFFMRSTPSAFIPTEDQGVFFADLQMPDATTGERTQKVLQQMDSILATIPDVAERLNISGCSMLSDANGGSHGMSIIALKPWDQRRPIAQIHRDIVKKTSSIKEGKLVFFMPPTVPGFSVSSGFEIYLQDRTGGEISKFASVAEEFLSKLNKRPEIAYASTLFSDKLPQYEFTVDVDRCKMMKVNVKELFQTLQIYFGSIQASDFNRFTKYYKVMVQARADDRSDLNSLTKMKVRSSTDDMVPLDQLISFKKVYGPESVSRFNLYTAIRVNGAPAEGYSSGDAISAIEEVAETLPQGYSFDYSGLAREERGSGSQSAIVFLLCFVFVYLILSAQYESYILPLAVMLSLAIGLCGVFFFVWALNMSNNIYVQVALIMLIGLLAKNAILIVEFALQRRQQGMPIIKAAVEGATARLRPILMTSFAFIFGMLPLVRSSGAGALGNQSIGVAAAAGMTVGTLFGIFIIPSLFVLFRTVDEKISPSRIPSGQE